MPRAKRASPRLWAELRPLVRESRGAPTPAEERLWQSLRRGTTGFKFRRQHAIDRFVVDFYCAQARLVIEVDGPIHKSQVDADTLRTTMLEALGLRVLRFTNDDVLQDVEAVVKSIREATSPP